MKRACLLVVVLITIAYFALEGMGPGDEKDRECLVWLSSEDRYVPLMKHCSSPQECEDYTKELEEGGGMSSDYDLTKLKCEPFTFVVGTNSEGDKVECKSDSDCFSRMVYHSELNSTPASIVNEARRFFKCSEGFCMISSGMHQQVQECSGLHAPKDCSYFV